MSTNNRNIENEGNFDENKNVSGRPQGTNSGPVAGGADNTRGENKPSHEGSSAGAKKGKNTPDNNSPQGSHANKTTSRGADSSDKEFRNNQPNASTTNNSKGLGNKKD
ncbi:hypothetical protein [Pontibacter liquoris]|uniref:hypothetical protein n=1 Tax=Pontibacter liquoris TaxID=2905677 RepID=UPI001FA8063F|nr:hypothetical protein [Pontibacter liquoris]